MSVTMCFTTRTRIVSTHGTESFLTVQSIVVQNRRQYAIETEVKQSKLFRNIPKNGGNLRMRTGRELSHARQEPEVRNSGSAANIYEPLSISFIAVCLTSNSSPRFHASKVITFLRQDFFYVFMILNITLAQKST